jgi:hypothetical protein
MGPITPELRLKFLRFREVHEFTKVMLQEAGASGSVIAAEVWKAAEKEVPLTTEELKIYKMHVALQSVNGGALFAIEDSEES